MRTIALLWTVVLGGTSLVEGHNAWVRVAVNGVWARPFEHIRKFTPDFIELPRQNCVGCNPRCWYCPTYANSDYPASVRCGRGHMDSAAETTVLRVKAGDEVTILSTTLAPEYNLLPVHDPRFQWDGCPNGRGICVNASYPRSGSDSTIDSPDRVYHNGPVMAHLSKVPEGKDVHDYDGSGKWTKIYTLGAELTTDVDREDLGSPYFWKPAVGMDWNVPSPPFKFKIPKQTPAGQYLLRMDSVNLGFHVGQNWKWQNAETQVYPGCAQIEVESEYSGNLPEGSVSFPEALYNEAPGMSQLGVRGEFGPGRYDRIVLDPNYVYPGGPLWDGEKLEQDRVV